MCFSTDKVFAATFYNKCKDSVEQIDEAAATAHNLDQLSNIYI